MKKFDLFSDVLGHEREHFTEEGQRDYIEAFSTLQKLLSNLSTERKLLLNDLANSNYLELNSIIDFLTK